MNDTKTWEVSSYSPWISWTPYMSFMDHSRVCEGSQPPHGPFKGSTYYNAHKNMTIIHY